MSPSETESSTEAELLLLQADLQTWIDQVCDLGPYSEQDLPEAAECRARLDAGVPLLPGGVRPSRAAAQAALQGLMKLLRRYLPDSTQALDILERSVAEAGGASALLDMVLGGRGNAMLGWARRGGVADDLAVFHAVLLARPFRTWFARRLLRHVEAGMWSHGYCPLCGHWPSLGLLDGQEDGRRYLWCQHCGSQWRHPRLRCVFCATEDQSSLSVYSVDGLAGWRIQGCGGCRRYVKEVRLQQRREDAPCDALRLGTLALDEAAMDVGLLRESPLIAHHEREAPPLGFHAPSLRKASHNEKPLDGPMTGRCQ